MTKITSAFDSPLQGMSQQRPEYRQPNQVTLLKNTIPSITKGVIKRNGTTLLRTIPTETLSGALLYGFNAIGRDVLYLQNPSTSPVLYDVSGNLSLMLSEHNPSSYYTTSTPSSSLKLTTIADTTFLYNTKVPVKMDVTQRLPDIANAALIFVRNVNFGATYKITLDYASTLHTITVSAADGGSPSHTAQTQPSYVANLILGALTSAGLIALGFDIELRDNDSLIKISRTDTLPFSLKAEDGTDGDDIRIIRNSVEDISDLPARAYDDFQIQVKGRGAADSFWLKFNDDERTWDEVSTHGTLNTIESGSMPHLITSSNGINFVLATKDWDTRKTGDDTNNPLPLSEFIDLTNDNNNTGGTINDINVFQNRLVLSVDNKVIMSKSGSFFDYFRDSTQVLLDTDPISVFSNTDKVQELKSSAILDSNIIFFGQTHQFLIKGNLPLSPTNATLEVINEYDNFNTFKPISSGRSLFFPVNQNGFTNFRELKSEDFESNRSADSISLQIKDLMGGIPEIIESTNDLLLCKLVGDPRIYVFSWVDIGRERLQSAWHVWEFANQDLMELRHFWVASEKVYLVFVGTGSNVNTYIEVLDFDEPNADGLDFPLHLDHKQVVPYVDVLTGMIGDFLYTKYDLTTNLGEAAIGLSYILGSDWDEQFIGVNIKDREDLDVSDPDRTIIIEAGGSSGEVSFYTPTGLVANSTTGNTTVGFTFESSIELTEPMIKDQNGKPQKIDRLMMNRAFINYESVGDIRVEIVDAFDRSSPVRDQLESVRKESYISALETGADNASFQVPLRTQADGLELTIIADTHFPVTFGLMEWSGQYKQRGRRR